ncbi:probable G-protein coupled receptor Mth-like 1 isoform X4 [Palaemon carinicauda]|uniref:probable G-protein coupled receptor Mth-like 1 isoform X4 n=1 Tax=Palaemon carinicauda TaxID=392227 RepID=UPI0035B6AB78
MLNIGVNARKLVALAMLMQTFVSPIHSASEDQLSLSASTFKPENLTTEKANADDFTTTTEVSTTTTEVSTITTEVYTTTNSDPRIDDSFSDVGGIEESISSEDGDIARNNTVELQTFVSTTSSGDVDDNATTETPSGEPGTICPATACGGCPCMRRCCDDGSSYNSSEGKCSPDSNSAFSPLDVANSSSYTIVTGLPVCKFLTKYDKDDKKISINREGQLSINYTHYSSSEYCLDVRTSVYFCRAEPLSWESVRFPIFLTCKVISVFFLILCIICYQLVPKLKANGGTHQLCHALSLFIAYSMGFAVNFFNEDFARRLASIFSLAIGLQFGFLAAFFWLNIMCFEVWRKIRKLTKYQTSKKYPEIYFLLYGWGVPLCICGVTVAMQFGIPREVMGEIRLFTDCNNCWIMNRSGVSFSFYCPVGGLFLCNALLLILTFIDTKKILRNSEEVSRELNAIGRSSRDMVDYVKDFHHNLKLFAISVICLPTTKFLSFLLPPLDIWAFIYLLNALQGLFVFIIMMTNNNKRKLIEKQFPLPFRLARRCSAALRCFRRTAAAERRDKNASSSEPESSKSDSVSMETTTSTLTLSCFSSVNNVQDGGDSCKV